MQRTGHGPRGHNTGTLPAGLLLLTPVRTPGPLLPGAWRAVISVGVSYD